MVDENDIARADDAGLGSSSKSRSGKRNTKALKLLQRLTGGDERDYSYVVWGAD